VRLFLLTRFSPLAARSAGLLRAGTPAIIGAGRSALSGAECGTTLRLPFEGDDPIAKRSVLGFLVAQSLGEV
jgi:hypothetical protein